MNTIWRQLQQNTWRACRDAPIAPLLVVTFVMAALFVPHFCTAYNLKNYLLQSADLLSIPPINMVGRDVRGLSIKNTQTRKRLIRDG